MAELGFAEQFATRAMRVQWTHIGDGRRQSLVPQRAFDALDMPEGAELVAELTEALIRSTRRPLSLPCPKWRVLTSDEARLLNFLAALQMRDGSRLPIAIRTGARRGRARPSGRPPGAWRSPSRRPAFASA